MKLGKKGKANIKNIRELKRLFSAMNINYCEMCGTRFGLSFAHSLKRRHINSDELMKEVALLCISPCHESLERLPEAEMTIKIREIIAFRGVYSAA